MLIEGLSINYEWDRTVEECVLSGLFFIISFIIWL